ncbi:MAG: hypothetical protein WAV72_24835 [Bradyrhizobium sp.]
MATQQMLDDLRAAYFSGATSISYEGKNIAYRSGAEMRAAILSLERQLGIKRPTRVTVFADKGWQAPGEGSE